MKKADDELRPHYRRADFARLERGKFGEDAPPSPSGAAIGYDASMSVAVGTVKDGKVILEGIELPDGTVVTILADDDRPAVKLPPELEADLQEAIDEADAEDGGAGAEFIESLRRYG